MKIEVEIPDYIEDGSVSEAIERRITERLCDEIKRETRDNLRAAIVEKAKAVADTTVDRLISESLSLTNAYGELMGGKTTLRELIAAEATKRLDMKVDAKTGGSQSYNRASCSRIEWIVKDAVGKVVAEQLKDVEDRVRAEAFRAMAEWLESHGHSAKDEQK